jgi:hypothetical protein
MEMFRTADEKPPLHLGCERWDGHQPGYPQAAAQRVSELAFLPGGPAECWICRGGWLPMAEATSAGNDNAILSGGIDDREDQQYEGKSHGEDGEPSREAQRILPPDAGTDPRSVGCLRFLLKVRAGVVPSNEEADCEADTKGHESKNGRTGGILRDQVTCCVQQAVEHESPNACSGMRLDIAGRCL